MTRADAPAASVAPTVRPVDVAAAAEAGRVDLAAVAEAASSCRACDLWARATQTVFGHGPVPAPLMLVGEQPGDHEDVEGAPFVGPAGRVLDEAMRAAGLDRERAFVTNVVKHFKWRAVPGQKRRLHERPTRAEVGACLPWVVSELALVRPDVLVLLGATAAQALIGPGLRITRDRGRQLESELAPVVIATIHPSAVLRVRGRSDRTEAMASLVRDLEVAGRRLRRRAAVS